MGDSGCPCTSSSAAGLRKFQSVSFNGSEPLDEVTKLQDVEGMDNGKSLGNESEKLALPSSRRGAASQGRCN